MAPEPTVHEHEPCEAGPPRRRLSTSSSFFGADTHVPLVRAGVPGGSGSGGGSNGGGSGGGSSGGGIGQPSFAPPHVTLATSAPIMPGAAAGASRRPGGEEGASWVWQWCTQSRIGTATEADWVLYADEVIDALEELWWATDDTSAFRYALSLEGDEHSIAMACKADAFHRMTGGVSVTWVRRRQFGPPVREQLQRQRQLRDEARQQREAAAAGGGGAGGGGSGGGGAASSAKRTGHLSGASVRGGGAGAPLPLSMEELRAIHARLEAAAAAAEAEVVALPADFERALGTALKKQLDGVGGLRLLELLATWDPERTGLKRVDFRRHVRTGLKLSGATNAEIDGVFDEVTGGGGAALAAPKALKPRLEKALERAATPEPLVAALEQRAAAKRGALAPVERALEALAAVHEAEALEEAQRERAVLAARRTAAALQAAVVEAEKARAAEEAAAKEAAALKEKEEEKRQAAEREKRETDKAAAAAAAATAARRGGEGRAGEQGLVGRLAASRARPSGGGVVLGVHHDFTCDRSGMSPIVGTRFHWRDHDYDLCEAEWLKLPAAERASYDAIAPPPGSAANGARQTKAG